MVKVRAVFRRGVGKGTYKHTAGEEHLRQKMIALDTHELGWVTFAFGFAIGFAKISMLAPTRLKMGLEVYPRLLMASSHVAYILCGLVRNRARWEAGCKSIHKTLFVFPRLNAFCLKKIITTQLHQTCS